MLTRLKNHIGKVLFEGMDLPLVLALTVLIGLGLVMVISASAGYALTLDNPSLYAIANKQIIYFSLAITALLLMIFINTTTWYNLAMFLLFFAYVLLILVYIPKVGVNLNASRRWIGVGGLTIQVSEVARLCILIYLASYMARRGERVRTSLLGFMVPMIVIGIAALLLLAEPDLGAAAVLATTCMGLLFLAGAQKRHFVATLLAVASLAALLIMFADYRQRRLIFLDPWQDAIGSGYQLIQSLTAFASGGFSGVGLGASIQKLDYLPEAHNDFVFAILAEELGFIFVVLVLCLYLLLIWRVFVIGAKALLRDMQFGAFLCFGIGVWLSCQVLINLGVTMGLLPTKGLVLPFMSSGGSAVIMTGAALGMVLRINYEALNTVLPEITKQPNNNLQQFNFNASEVTL